MTTMMNSCDAFSDRLADYLEGDAEPAVRDAMDAHAATCDSCGPLLADLLLIPQEAAALPRLEPSRDLWTGIAGRIDAPVLPLAPRHEVRRAVAARNSWQRTAIAAAALVLFTASVTHVATRLALTAAPVAPAAGMTVASTTHTAPPAEPNAVPNAEISSTATESVAPREGTRDAARETSRAEPVRATTTEAARGGTVRLASTKRPLADAEPVYDSEIAKLRRIVTQRHSQLDPATIAVLEQSMAVIDSAIAQSRSALARDPASGFLATQLNHSLEKKVELLRTAASLPAHT